MNTTTPRIILIAGLVLMAAILVLLPRPARAVMSHSAAGGATATIKGIQTHYVYDRAGFFPAAWLADPIDCGGAQIAASEMERAARLIDMFVAAYDAAFLQKNLTDIYLAGDLHCYGRAYGGTNSTSSIYIRVGSRAEGYTDRVLLATMHEEFSSILLRQYAFPAGRWALFNGADYRYPDDSIEILDQAGVKAEPPAALLQRGFLSNYAASSFENDVNEYAGWMLVWPDRLCDFAAQYPAILHKAQLLSAFYLSIEPNMEAWDCAWDPPDIHNRN